tara:strand:+ start:177 stop:335 length:159 start_codon:yes stop_codon:yes gene_type:complete
MSNDKNLEKSSQDYKKSQYGSWYKKSEANKKANLEKKELTLLEKISSFFKNK